MNDVKMRVLKLLTTADEVLDKAEKHMEKCKGNVRDVIKPGERLGDYLYCENCKGVVRSKQSVETIIHTDGTTGVICKKCARDHGYEICERCGELYLVPDGVSFVSEFICEICKQ